MEDNECKACGHHGLVYKNHGYALGLFCEKCRDGFYTISDVDLDIPVYSQIVEGLNPSNKSHIAFIAKLCNVNYLTANMMISESKRIRIKGNALKIEEIMSWAARLALAFESPFAYSNQHGVVKSDFEDLSSYAYYLNKPIDVIYNVGWLAGLGEYPRGRCAPEFIGKLKAVFRGTERADFAFNRVRGNSPCVICWECLVIDTMHREIPLGFCELLIPSLENGKFYASPSLIIHYIEEHGYQPPDEYVKAVMVLDVCQDFSAQQQFDALRLIYR
ncbi:hypothetical protein [Leminorella grimontii]|uniref:DUF7919 family protein n=1 Tax=Leminorella grimontii TaxID=82981 RepID=UPI0032203E8D